jgi:hypothetical protein
LYCTSSPDKQGAEAANGKKAKRNNERDKPGAGSFRVCRESETKGLKNTEKGLESGVCLVEGIIFLQRGEAQEFVNAEVFSLDPELLRLAATPTRGLV